jgi:hypothetical protein
MSLKRLIIRVIIPIIILILLITLFYIIIGANYEKNKHNFYMQDKQKVSTTSTVSTSLISTGVDNKPFHRDLIIKKHIVLCLFGVISRSIKYTYKSIKENIIDVLNNNYIVDIYVFNLNIKNNKIDGEYVNQKDVSIIPYNYYEEYQQDILDAEIEDIKKKINIKFRPDYYPEIIKNAMRQMYSEHRVGLFLEKNLKKYDIAVVCGPDYFIANKININDIENSYINNNFYTSTVNDASGYTNGFYIGKPDILIRPLLRYKELYRYLPTDKDYESVLKDSIVNNNITRNITKIVFFKIRANKTIAWQGGGRTDYLDTNEEKKEVNKKYNELKTYLSKL